uniref:Uncharacterized protein n=1 Tax=viral metagenome TaxID=1070528 RepID=A0A6M3KW33_9ZZZZ
MRRRKIKTKHDNEPSIETQNKILTIALGVQKGIGCVPFFSMGIIVTTQAIIVLKLCRIFYLLEGLIK